jgi:hypothetical protein
MSLMQELLLIANARLIRLLLSYEKKKNLT